MTVKQKVTKSTLGIPAGLGIGALISMILTMAGAAVISHMIVTERIGEGAMGVASMVVIVIAAAMGAWGASSAVKRLRLQVCMMTGGCYFLLLVALTALFFDGRYQGMLLTAGMILIGCAIIAFIPSKKGSNWRKRKKAYR